MQYNFLYHLHHQVLRRVPLCLFFSAGLFDPSWKDSSPFAQLIFVSLYYPVSRQEGECRFVEQSHKSVAHSEDWCWGKHRGDRRLSLIDESQGLSNGP